MGATLGAGAARAAGAAGAEGAAGTAVGTKRALLTCCAAPSLALSSTPAVRNVPIGALESAAARIKAVGRELAIAGVVLILYETRLYCRPPVGVHPILEVARGPIRAVLREPIRAAATKGPA